MRKTILTAALLCAFLGTQAQEYYEKHVAFPAGATTEQKIDMASRLVPTPQQLAWQQMEFTCFLHFGINTFTGREWGDGKEDPAIFNPTELDCEQWVRALKEGGFKMAIITAKHHDGFCLWPTRTTKHSVASSPWKNGKGDVVQELRKACDKYGLKFGVYLSPWDRNAECYGQGEAYNKFFIEQLTELLTNYGEVHEVWFDGANGEGPNGKKQEYDWDAILKTIRRLQPKAVTAIMGDDVRWVGNEGGLGRTTEWSATALMPNSYPGSDEVYKRLGINAMSKDLGSRELVSKASDLFWYPSEVDVSIRPGWFYHAEQDNQVRSLANLVNIYYRSVGCNSVLLLNIPPDKRGLMHENDVKRIKELTEYIKKTFTDNKVEKGNRIWTAKVGDTKEYKVRKNTLVNPIEMMPGFFRTLYPLLPFTYSIDALRETIGGFYDGHWFGYIGKMLIFATLAFLLGLGARPKLANLNRLFAREIKESDMIIGEPVHITSNEYRVTQAIAALADRAEYRHAIERRAAKFAYHYPRLLLGALIAGFVVPAALIIVFSLTTSEKIVVMGTWLAWVLIIVGFLMVVEYMRDSIRRQTELGNLSDESIRTMLYRHKTGHRPPANVEARPDHSADTLTIPATPPTKEGKHAR